MKKVLRFLDRLRGHVVNWLYEGEARTSKVHKRPDLTGLGEYTLWWIFWAFSLSLILFLLLYWVDCGKFDFRHLTTTVMWALACMACGIAVGFLFGLPRVKQGDGKRPDPRADAGPAGAGSAGTSAPQPGTNQASPAAPSDAPAWNEADYSQRVNTNLEEISDWLTKIIVGLGLVELRRIPGYLHSLAVLLANCLDEECSLALASALIVWYSVLGFLTGYLVTRIFLAYVFAIADKFSRKGEVEQLRGEANELIKELVGQVKEAKEAKDKLEPEYRKELESMAAAAFAMPLVRDDSADPKLVKEAYAKLQNVLEKFPDNARCAVVLARLYRWKDKDLNKAIDLLTSVAAAMQDRGIKTGNPLATVLYNRACYHVQLAKALPAPSQDDFLKTAKVKEDLEQSFKLDVDFAKDAAKDEDLAPIYEKSWFKDLTKPAPAVPPKES